MVLISFEVGSVFFTTITTGDTQDLGGGFKYRPWQHTCANLACSGPDKVVSNMFYVHPLGKMNPF